ncbi:MAG: RNB domain-containing ribonuclease [Ornithinibacter sp.]
MPHPRVTLSPTEAETSEGVVAALRARFEAVREELGLSLDYPVEARREAEAVAAAPMDLPTNDQTGLAFFTLDPAGSMDLDQAMHLERDGDGHRVRYAIADVPAFVRLGGALDHETRERGQTVYCPDVRVPLHPEMISEGAASLLPGVVRPAFVWDLHLDGTGELVSSSVERAMVRSVERLDYTQVQGSVDDGGADERFVMLREVGERRIALERARGGASLPMPEQEVHEGPDGRFVLEFRPPVAAEDWNAQISLLTGMAAATMMIQARVGVLRTMPAPTAGAIARFRRAARALHANWPDGQSYGDFVRSLDRTNPRHLALIHEATTLFRGAGYTAFDGEVPTEREHGAVAAPYAHVTAPLRRLVDRFGLLVCEAVCRGDEVPEEVRAALPALPDLMRSSDQRTRAAERACADATEAAVLQGRVGEVFDAVVVDRSESGLEVQLVDLPVLTRVAGAGAELGASVRVRVATADVARGALELALD